MFSSSMSMASGDAKGPSIEQKTEQNLQDSRVRLELAQKEKTNIDSRFDTVYEVRDTMTKDFERSKGQLTAKAKHFQHLEINYKKLQNQATKLMFDTVRNYTENHRECLEEQRQSLEMGILTPELMDSSRDPSIRVPYPQIDRIPPREVVSSTRAVAVALGNVNVNAAPVVANIPPPRQKQGQGQLSVAVEDMGMDACIDRFGDLLVQLFGAANAKEHKKSECEEGENMKKTKEVKVSEMAPNACDTPKPTLYEYVKVAEPVSINSRPDPIPTIVGDIELWVNYFEDSIARVYAATNFVNAE